MARLVTVVLQRVDDSVPWGFRIQGGADYNQPLSVQRVTPGALASQQLDPGDVLIMIEGQDARLMCHFDAYELIKMAGNTVELIVRKANSKHLCAENLVQQEKLEQTVVEERYKQEEEKRRRKALKDSRSPPFSSGSSGHSHSARSPPARGMSPQEVPLSPTVGATALPFNTMPQVSQMGNNENSSYSSTHFPFQKFEGQQISGVPENTSLQSQIRQIMSPKIRTFIPITSPTQRFSSEPQPLSPPIHQPLRNTFSLSPPVRPASQRFFPISPPTLPPISKPYTNSPSVRQSNAEKLYRNSDSRKLTTFQTINTQENVECYTIEQSEAMPMPTSLTSHQSQKTRSQTVSSVQQMSRENVDMIKTSSQNITSSPNTIKVYRRTSCSPQRIIPPLPKTIFSEDKPISQNKYTGEFQRSQSTQEFDSTYQTTHFVDNLRRSSLKNDTPNRSLRLFSPKPFSPPVHEADGQQTLSSPPVVTGTSNFSTPLRMFSPHNLPNQQQIQNHAEINPQALSKKLQALAQSEDLASSSSQGSGAYASADPLGIERRSISQEREPMTMEEYKQRQLQKLIEEKVRLEEMMMIAKRRQSLSESHESSMKKKENKVLSISTTDSCNAREISEQALELEPIIKNIDTQNNLHSTKSEGVSSPSSSLLVENKTQALREKEEESRLRKENQIRDEKIRRMQERRYEEKLKKNSLKTSRDRSCPPDPKLELNSQTDLRELGDRKSRERSRVIQKEKLVRDRSCPINIDQMGNGEFGKIETEEKHIPKDKTLIASTFISSMLKDMKIGFKDLGQKKIASQNRNERTIPIKFSESEAIKRVSDTDMPSKAEIKLKPSLTDNNEKEKNEEKKKLFESLKKDQQRIQEEFRKREELKIKEEKEAETKRNLMQAQNKLQNDSQHWHEQLQKKQDFNKSIEKKVQHQLKCQDDVQNKKVLSYETTHQKNYSDQSYQNFKDKDKLNKEKIPEANKNYKAVQMQENMTNQELHVSELQKQLKIKEELQWQELQKESNIQSQNSIETSLVQDHINKPPNKQDVKVLKGLVDQEEKLKKIKSDEGAKKFEIIKKEEEKRQNELRIRENLLKIEEKKLIEKIISEEERKLLEQKRNIEERLKRQSSDSSSKRLTTASVPVIKPTTSNLTKERPSTLKKSDLISLEGQTFYINPDQDLCKENDGDEEGTIDDLRKEEEERMKEEAKIYEEYKRHLETKRKGHYDSDDYASEWDTGEEEDDKEKPRGLYLEETFDELKATSEEELYDAQEKSIRNLERQIRKQKQREMRKCYEKRHLSNQLSKRNSKSSSNEASPPQQKKYSSTGDLHSTPSRTRPITKFSPDPMEFGFRPIETPHSIISRSVGNLMSGGGPSASSIAHVAGAEAGVAAIKKPICKKFYYSEEKPSKEMWNNRYRISSSLEDLQQVSRKPPLPIQAKLKSSTLRHATSEETIVKYERPCEDPRRHTYTEGEDFSELAYLDTLDLDPSDYGNLLNEYYAAYYDTYYQSYYRRHQSEKQREGKMMNLGPPPPPPPPPFSTGAPAPIPRQPMEVPSKAPPPVAVPSALAGAMLKEKKPFTYTPGGLNLAEIKSPRMQRRLQRNASLEGVRPSPLAQQPPPSPGASTSSLPAYGMIQVLPMPGMGMTPIAKHQPQPKEPPKPARNVCGPAPPPPPFMISGDSSVEQSPSSTPLTTPATTPAINSATPPSTPISLSTHSASSAPAVYSQSIDSNTSNQINNDKSGLNPEMATEPGPSIPHPPPPPPPPPSSTLDRKKYSLPSLSSQQSSSSKNETESELSISSNISSYSPPVEKFANNIPQSIKLDNTKPSESVSATSQLGDSSSPSLPTEQIKLKENAEANKTTFADHSQIMEKQKCKELINEKPIINNAVNSHTSLNEIVNDKKSASLNNATMISDMNCVNKIQDILDEIDSSHIPEIIDDIVRSNKKSDISNVIEQKSLQNSNETHHEVIKSSSPTIIKQKMPENQKETVSIKKVETNEENIVNKQINNATVSSKNISTEEQNISNLTIKPTPIFNEYSVNNIVSPPQPPRPILRMASPPATIKSQNPPKYDRMVRQASLPVESTSPPAAIKPGNKGSLYIPPIKPSSAFGNNNKSVSQSASQSASPASQSAPQSAPQSAQSSSSSPSGLNKGPLPWMCGVKKEPSPPPEFLVYAQKAQDRIQRQRSLSQQETRQLQFSPPQKQEVLNSCQNGFMPSTPFSPEVAPSKDFRNHEPEPHYSWRSPEHQGVFKNQMQQRQPQQHYQHQLQQQHQQQQHQQQQQHEQQQNYQNQQFQQQQYQQQQQKQQQHQQQQHQQQQYQPQQHQQQQYQQQQHQQQQHQQQQQMQQQMQHQRQLPPKFQQNSNQLHNINLIQPQPQQPQQTRQTKFTQSSQQTSLTQQGHPRERIIPIMMEESSPVTPPAANSAAGVHNAYNKVNYTNQPRIQRLNSWPKPSSVPSSPMGAGGAFSPYDPQGKYQSSSNALEALQQMQQNLAQLNSGLQTAYPRVIHQQLHSNISPSHPMFSAQNQPQQNGAPYIVHQAGPQDPVMQSRSFRVLQNAYDNHEATGNQVEENPIEPKKYMGSHIPSRSFRMLQAMTDDGPGPGESDL